MKFKKALILLVAASAVTGCLHTSKQMPVDPEMTFDHVGDLNTPHMNTIPPDMGILKSVTVDLFGKIF